MRRALHHGIGVEVVPWKHVGRFPGGAEPAFRAEYAWYTQRLGLDFSTVSLRKLEIAFPTLGDGPVTSAWCAAT